MGALPADAPSENILYSLHDGLRSLQVLQIGEERVLDLTETKLLQGIYDLGVDVLSKALERIGVQLILWPEPYTERASPSHVSLGPWAIRATMSL
jgi:hypothetical protein